MEMRVKQLIVSTTPPVDVLPSSSHVGLSVETGGSTGWRNNNSWVLERPFSNEPRLAIETVNN